MVVVVVVAEEVEVPAGAATLSVCCNVLWTRHEARYMLSVSVYCNVLWTRH